MGYIYILNPMIKNDNDKSNDVKDEAVSAMLENEFEHHPGAA